MSRFSPSSPAILSDRLHSTALVLGATLALATFLALARMAAADTPRVHAIVGARIVTAPGQVIERGTVVMRDGVIRAVGRDVAVPPDARIWAGDSLTVYAGLIDPFIVPAEHEGSSGDAAPARRRASPSSPARGADHALEPVHPELRVTEEPPLESSQLEALRAAGFTTAHLTPRAGIFRGQSAVIGLSGDGPTSIVRADLTQVIAFEPSRQTYPASLMGTIAVVRQGLLDAAWYAQVEGIYARAPQGKERPEKNVAWESMQALVTGRQPAMFVASDMLQVLRASTVAREAKLVTALVVGSGDEYKRARDIAETGLSIAVPVNYPDAPDVSDPDLAVEITTEELRHWDQAPGNAAALTRAKVPFAFTTRGLKDVKTFRANVGKAIGRGLGADDALAAVTVRPARMLGLTDRLGTIAVGKIANLTVVRGELFSEQGKVCEVWIDGNRLPVMKDEAITGRFNIGWGSRSHLLLVEADKDTTVKLVVGSDTLAGRGVRLEKDRLRFTVQRGHEPAEIFDLKVRYDVVRGTLALASEPAGRSHAVIGARAPKKDDEKGGTSKEKAAEPDVAIATPAVMGNPEAWRAARPEQPAAVLVRGATLWTAGPQGTLENTDLLVRAGKIAAIGRGLKAPSGAAILDAAGRHVSPGIIDEHSHAAGLGNINECTNNVTSEVRLRDIVNSESPNIYRHLAGGTTVMHMLHGSCNSIGGQAMAIKNRWGESPENLLFTEADASIKFALGENPKQSNWGAEATGRYPKSRAGVEQSIRDAFSQARDYRAAREEFRQNKRPYPPRPDLQLDALVEILEGKRSIHCHSYRQDEILMLMRVAEEYGFRVGTFTHILEGYKVADEMATHGAMASSFSDWWGYKYEVIDAIPHNGFIMWDRGVVTSFNSDDAELARRLNTESAKAVKYGGVPPDEAIKFCTINPARQIGAADRVGSLEVGKDADFVVWSGSPLSPLSACEQTWIEGRKYFDRAQDLAGRQALADERTALVAKARTKKKKDGGGEKGSWPPLYLEATGLGGNECGAEQYPFHSDAERHNVEGGQR